MDHLNACGFFFFFIISRQSDQVAAGCQGHIQTERRFENILIWREKTRGNYRKCSALKSERLKRGLIFHHHIGTRFIAHLEPVIFGGQRKVSGKFAVGEVVDDLTGAHARFPNVNRGSIGGTVEYHHIGIAAVVSGRTCSCERIDTERLERIIAVLRQQSVCYQNIGFSALEIYGLFPRQFLLCIVGLRNDFNVEVAQRRHFNKTCGGPELKIIDEHFIVYIDVHILREDIGRIVNNLNPGGLSLQYICGADHKYSEEDKHASNSFHNCKI